MKKKKTLTLNKSSIAIIRNAHYIIGGVANSEVDSICNHADENSSTCIHCENDITNRDDCIETTPGNTRANQSGRSKVSDCRN